MFLIFLKYVGHITYFHDAHVYCVLLGHNYLNSFHMSGMWLKNSDWNLCNIFRLSLPSVFWWLLVLMTSCFDIVILSALFLWQLSSSLKQYLDWDCTYAVPTDKLRWNIPELPKGDLRRWFFFPDFVNDEHLGQKVLCFSQHKPCMKCMSLFSDFYSAGYCAAKYFVENVVAPFLSFAYQYFPFLFSFLSE